MNWPASMRKQAIWLRQRNGTGWRRANDFINAAVGGILHFSLVRTTPRRIGAVLRDELPPGKPSPQI